MGDCQFALPPVNKFLQTLGTSVQRYITYSGHPEVSMSIDGSNFTSTFEGPSGGPFYDVPRWSDPPSLPDGSHTVYNISMIFRFLS